MVSYWFSHETLYHTLWRITGLLQRIAAHTNARENCLKAIAPREDWCPENRRERISMNSASSASHGFDGRLHSSSCFPKFAAWLMRTPTAKARSPDSRLGSSCESAPELSRSSADCAGEYVALEEIDNGMWNVYCGPLSCIFIITKKPDNGTHNTGSHK